MPFLKEGTEVTTTKAHVHYIATEYGMVNLYGKNLKQRAKALISIAHPDIGKMWKKPLWSVLNKPLPSQIFQPPES